MPKVLSAAVVKAAREKIARPFTSKELQWATGCTYTGALTYVRIMRKSEKAHISGWQTGFGKPMPRYELGPGEDVPPPPVASPAQRQVAKRVRTYWGASDAAIDAALKRRIKARTKAFERGIENLKRSAEEAKDKLAYRQPSRVAKSAPRRTPSISLFGQVAAANRSAP
jgi:hypothetical protein